MIAATDQKPVNLNDPENPEWTESDFAAARPAAEVLPPEVIAAFGKKRGRPKAEETKRPVNVRISERVIRHFQTPEEKGWQTRMNTALELMVDRWQGYIVSLNEQMKGMESGRFSLFEQRPEGKVDITAQAIAETRAQIEYLDMLIERGVRDVQSVQRTDTAVDSDAKRRA